MFRYTEDFTRLQADGQSYCNGAPQGLEIV
jgi:hypothetical protein